MPAATLEHTQASLSELSLAELKQLCADLTIDGHRGKKQTYIDALLTEQQRIRADGLLFDTNQFAAEITETATSNHYDLEDSAGRRKAASRKRHSGTEKPTEAPKLQAESHRCEVPRPANHPDGEEVEILKGDHKVPAGRYRVKILQSDSEATIFQFGSEIPLEGDDCRLYFSSDFRVVGDDEEETTSFIPSPLFPIPPAEPEEDGDRDKEEVDPQQQLQVSNRIFTRNGVAGEILRKEGSFWVVQWASGLKWAYTSEQFQEFGYRFGPTRSPLILKPDLVPPDFGRKPRADEVGQLSLFEWEEEEEAPDPDDFPSVKAYESAWAEWCSTHAEVPGFSSSTQSDRATEKFPAAKYRGAITRAEAAEALGVSSDRILKDPTELWNAVVVVYLDDAGKKCSRFVSYRKFRRWWESFVDSLFTDAIAQTVRHELQRYGDYCPSEERATLESLLQPQEREQAIEREAIAA